MTLQAILSRSMLASSLLLGSTFAHSVTPAADTGSTPSFEQRLETMLNDSREKRRGLVFHVRGQRIAGEVREIATDAIVVANQEYDRILIRRALIVALEGN
jgi:hypothetical protein